MDDRGNPQLTIHTLEVQLDVEGDGDEAIFGRLFRRYIGEWQRRQQEEQFRRRLAERDRRLGGSGSGGDGPC